MRLKKKDKEWLRAEIKAAVEEALTIEMEIEQRRDPETGLPLATPRIVNEKVFLPVYFALHLKFHEGAFRGNQETLDKVKNNANNLGEKVNAMGAAMLEFEKPMIVLERFVGLLAKTGIMGRLEDLLTIDTEGHETKKIASGS